MASHMVAEPSTARFRSKCSPRETKRHIRRMASRGHESVSKTLRGLILTRREGRPVDLVATR